MKHLKTLASAVLAFTLLAGCSDNDSSSNTKKVNPKIPLKMEDLKYAGAVIYELGTVDKIFDNKSKNPISQIYVCLERSGSQHAGQIMFKFSDLNVPPYRTVWKSTDSQKVTHIFDLVSLSLDYHYSATIIDSGLNAWGEATFESSTSHRLWETVYPKEDDGSSTDHDGLFRTTITKNNFSASTTHYYEVDGQTYYVGSTYIRVVKNEQGLSPIMACEESNEPVFFKYFENY